MRGPRSFTFPSFVPFSFISMKSERAWVPLLPRRLVDHSRMFEMKFENFVRYPILNIQVNLFQKHLFLYQLTHNMTKDCSLNYEFSTWKFQAQNMLRTCCVHKLFFCFCFDIQNNLCTQHVLPMFWACNFHEQSIVILWVSWYKNKCFWKIFTSTS